MIVILFSVSGGFLNPWFGLIGNFMHCRQHLMGRKIWLVPKIMKGSTTYLTSNLGDRNQHLTTAGVGLHDDDTKKRPLLLYFSSIL